MKATKARQSRTRGKPPRREARRAPVARRRVTIVVVHDHEMVREGLRHLLEAQPGFRVLGGVANGADAIRDVAHSKPDILLLDGAVAKGGGAGVLDELSAGGAATRAVVLVPAIDSADVAELLRRGARGVLLSSAPTAVLFECLRRVANGQYWVGGEEVRNVVEYMGRAGVAPRDEQERPVLTPRELDIVSAIVSGLGNRDMARQFSLSEQTVKHHLTRIYDKLGVANRLELALYAIQRRLVDEVGQ
jgi:DNA-binding NarL/FixJ family response regulator